MPKPGAFDKAKVKGSGGFGASKSGRFDGPKESCDYTPSASAYNAYVSIGEPLPSIPTAPYPRSTIGRM